MKKEKVPGTKTDVGGFKPGHDYVILGDLTISDSEEMPPHAIGGFHTLCADVGDIPRHPLSGYRAGDPLPLSLWNNHHRPACPDPRGFVYDPNTDVWVKIYLAADSKGNPFSLSYKEFVEYGKEAGLRLLTNEEFSSAADGSNEQTVISTRKRPNGCGSHIDNAGRRMISNIGCEDCCGVLWQWLSTPHPTEKDWALLAGGLWVDAAYAGSRSRSAADYRWDTYTPFGARFASEPLHKRVAR